MCESLSNFTQRYQVFICDFIATAKICHQNLFKLYCDLNHKYGYDHFTEFLDLASCISENLSIAWWKHLDSGIEYLAFHIKGKLYMMHKLVIGLGVVGMVTWDDWELACENVQMQCITATTSLIDE